MAIKEDLIKILGEAKVTDTPEELEKFAKDESFVNHVSPRCVVKPTNSAEIQKIILWANNTGNSLIPVSSGDPHFRGDTVPSIGGIVIVNLSSMNRIIRVDGEHRVAMVEPGVTFSQLLPEIKNAGLRLNMPLLPKGSKSVVGSLLEREPVIMPKYHWDISDPLSCVEIVYGTGDFFRTGAAAGPGNVEEQWKAGAHQNEAAGPIQAGFHRLIQGAQGTMGIVTWASMRCEFAPKVEEPYLVGSSKLDNIVEFTHWLIRNRMADDCLLLNNTNLSRIIANNDPQEYAEIKTSLPAWILYFSLSGNKYLPEEKLAYLKGDLATLAQSTDVEPVKAIGKVSAFELMKAIHETSPEPYWKLRAKGSCHDIIFISTCDYLDDLTETMTNLAAKYEYPIADLGIYLQPIVQGVNYHCEFNLFFDPKNSREKENVFKLSEAAFNILCNKGAFFSRPYHPWTDGAYRKDTETTIALRKVKKIFDPNNVMNPGKLCFE